MDGTTGAARAGWQAVAHLHHALFTGLLLAVATRAGAATAGRLTFLTFRRLHEAKFLSSSGKLGLEGLPHAVAAARYHYLSNSIGGVGVEYVEAGPRKAWVHFTHPRWLYEGAALCGMPVEVSRGFLEGWYARNGISLGNPRLGFVCTSEDMTGQYGFAGYFVEEDEDLAPEDRLRFRPGEICPRFDAAAAPTLDASQWDADRLAKANRTYAMDYVATALPALAELVGPMEAARLGAAAAGIVGRQLYRANQAILGLDPGAVDADAFAGWLAAFLAGMDDPVEVAREGDAVLVRQGGWRLMRGRPAPAESVFDGWSGLVAGALAVHDRFLALDVVERLDRGDAAFTWRIRPRR